MIVAMGDRMSWNPAQYLKYSGERLRPALDLLARIDVEAPRVVVDLGEIFVDRFATTGGM